MISEGDIADLGQFIINELGKELVKQDHKNTGNLINSLDYELQGRGDLLSLVITSLPYGENVNTGRRRGGKKVPINVLVEWIKQKGIETNNKKAVGIAFAIQKSIEKKGIPSKPYTKWKSGNSKKRVEFVDDTLERINNEIISRLTEDVFKTVEVQIDNLVKRI